LEKYDSALAILFYPVYKSSDQVWSTWVGEMEL